MATGTTSQQAERKIAEALKMGAIELNLTGLGLRKLPESIGQLIQLQELNLSSNELRELPESIGQLSQLQSLNLSFTRLTGLPELIGQFSQLKELNLSYNQLRELPESIGQLSQLQSLNLSSNELRELPKSIGQLSQLKELNLSYNQLTGLPESIGQLSQLQSLNLFKGELQSLPISFGNLTQLETLVLHGNNLTLESESNSLGPLIQLCRLDISGQSLVELPAYLAALKGLKALAVSDNRLTAIPEWIGNLPKLTQLFATNNQIESLPETVGNLKNLTTLILGGDERSFYQGWRNWGNNNKGHGNKLTSLPNRLADLSKLSKLNLDNNPLSPELAAAYEQDLDTVKAYLRARAENQIILNETKLILIGEGEVGKSCLLDALRDEPWQKHDSTHGIEIKPVLITHRNDDESATEITLNTWDFGGQKVYRSTHQFFFSAPAVYLVVWKPREGTQQGAVEYWINTIKHRAGADAKILIVGTHGGPQQRQPDIDLQDLRDKFGPDCILGAFHVNSQPEGYDETNKDTWTGERIGIAKLKAAIANVASNLPNVGREVATSWHNVLLNVKQRSKANPYISYQQFEELCNQETVSKKLAKTYASMLNQLGYVIHYGSDDDLKEFMILKPDWLAKAISFVLDDQTTRQRNGLVSHVHLTQLWSHPPYDYEAGYPEELHLLFRRLMERFDISYQVVLSPMRSRPTTTSLIAQLVSDQPKPLPDWGENPQPGDEEKRQICQIVEKEKNQSANAEGLFYRLIARLHKYSLGRDDYDKSVHWQRGLMLDDGYNGRALLRHIGNDIHITVRAAYPDYMLYELTKDVQELVQSPDQGWTGLRCDVVVPCIAPCRGMLKVEILKKSKREGRSELPCGICGTWHNIDVLLQNVTVTRESKLSESDINQIRGFFKENDKKAEQRLRALFSRADEHFAIWMQMSLDEGRNGPRLFSLTPADTNFRKNLSWTTQKFHLTLWCEHSRKPLPLLWGTRKGSYKLTIPRKWLEKYGPTLQMVTKTLSAILPVVAATLEFAIPESTQKRIEKNLDFGKELFEATLTGGEAIANIAGDDVIAHAEYGVLQHAQNSMLRELHALLQKRDPAFGGLVRVPNKRREFIWVHPQFKDEY